MVEEIESEELDATPEPTLTADPTATPSPITETPSDQGLANLTGVQVDAALTRFAFVEEWDYTDNNKSIGPAVGHFHFGFGHIFVRDPIIPCADSSNCKMEAESYNLSIGNASAHESQDEAYFIDRHDHLCITAAIKTDVVRGAKVSISGTRDFRLEKFRENDIVIPIDKPCDGFSNIAVHDETLRLFNSIINLLAQ